MENSGKTRILVAGIWVSVFVIILFTNFSNLVRDESLKNNQEFLQELSLRGAGVLKEKITLDTKLLKGIADNIREESELVSPKTFALLKAMSKQTDFARIVVITKYGKAFLDAEQAMNKEEEDVLADVFSGKTFVTRAFNSKIDNRSSNAILVPIYDDNGQVIGSLCGIHNIEIWNNLLDYSFSYDQASFYVVTANGDYALRSSEGIDPERCATMEEFLDKAKFVDDFSHDKIHEEMKQGRSGFAAMEIELVGQENIKRYLSYAPVGINDWYVFAIVPQENIARRSELIENLGRELIFKVVGVFILLIIYITMESRKTTRAIALSKERYRIAVEKSDTIIFDYDIRTDTMYNSSQLKKNFNLLSESHLYIYNICYPDDIDDLKKFVREFSIKKEEMNIECRLYYDNGEYKWNKFSLIPIFDAQKNFIDAIGILEDITALRAVEQKLVQAEKHTKILKRKAERDYLTGLYNKGEAEYLISKILQEDTTQMQAFIIIDLDNFKAINDNFGHVTGDDVLQKVAKCLQEIFRSSDVISRIGGDEFVVFLRDPGEINTVIYKIQEICDSLIFVYTKEEQEYKVSASVGCSIYPKNGKSFVDLYKKADEALYVTKRTKKGTFSISE